MKIHLYKAGLFCFTLTSLVIIAINNPLKAMMPPYVYENARKDASMHLQVKVKHVTPPDSSFGECRVSGLVGSIYRDKHKQLRSQMPIQFKVSCIVNDNTMIPVGGTIWQNYWKLAKSPYIEVFLNKSIAMKKLNGKRFEVAADQVILQNTKERKHFAQKK